MILRFLMGLMILLITCFGLSNAQEVYISSIDGAWDGNTKVKPDVPITWTFNVNTTPLGLLGSTNGFRVFLSSDGTVGGMLNPGPGFTPITYSSEDLFGNFATYAEQEFGVDGFGADTIGFGGLSFSAPAIILDEPTWTITTQVDSLADTYLCLDSAFFPPGGAWLWTMGDDQSVYPPWDGPLCYLIEESQCMPAVITDPPASLSFPNHCATATYQFIASDPDPLQCNPPGDGTVVFSMIDDGGSGSTITESGLWSMPANIDAHINSPYTITIRVDDACACGQEYSFDVSFENNTPFINCGSGTIVCAGNPIVPYQIIATDADECDDLNYSISGHDGLGNATIDPVTGVLNYLSHENEGGDIVLINVCVTDGAEVICCDVEITFIGCEQFEIQIEKTHGTFQGQHEVVDISVNSGAEDMWGFDILIAYDASALSFQTALPGSVYDACGWEYFTYRYGAQGNCGSACPSGIVRIVGIAEYNNGPNHPDCYDATGETLFSLDFLVTDDRTFECMYVPVRFFWMDCGDNAISYHEIADVSNPYSQILGISNHVNEFEGMEISNNNSVFPTYLGAPDEPCLEGDKDLPVRFVDFINGGIDIVCADSIDDRGDMNLNGVANEVADAVLYTNYFVFGIGVFDHYQAQVAASDINADGITLSVGDLVYLIRIVSGDALPIPKIVPVPANLIIDDIIKIDREMGAASISIEGNVAPELLVDNMDFKYSYHAKENVTHVLVYSLANGQSFSGEFIKPNGKVLDIELATYEGAPVKVDMLPSSFELKQNYPNPFNPTTSIEFTLFPLTEWQLSIFNVAGQEVYSTNGISMEGESKIEWSAGSEMSSGIYFYRLDADGFTDTKKMIFIK